jgi:uncharacterized protein involved in response to NO
MTQEGHTASSRRSESPIPLLRLGFRPFFLAAGVWAVLSVALWVGTFAVGITLPTAFDPVSWHIHEMIFGYALAAVSGFLLTAIPNWTGRLPVAGLPLAMLAGLWLAGRVACGISATIGPLAAAVIDLAFPALMLVVVVREITEGDNWRNLPMAVAVAVLLAANGLMHLESAGTIPQSGLGWRLGLSVVLMLIVLIGGRIVPSFTRNWLVKAQSPSLPAAFGRFDRLTMAATAVALVSWSFAAEREWTGVLLAFAGILNLARLGRWAGFKTAAEPLVWVLHLGYAWLGLGFVALGLAVSIGAISTASAVHALTIGAVGTMTLAVMTRASLGHSGRPLAADVPTTAAYVLVGLAAILRVLAELFGWVGTAPLLVPAGLWIAAFAAFVATYWRLWLTGGTQAGS